MNTALKVFSIIGIVFIGLAFLGNMGNLEALGYTFFVAMIWLPQSIIGLIVSNKKEVEKK